MQFIKWLQKLYKNFSRCRYCGDQFVPYYGVKPHGADIAQFGQEVWKDCFKPDYGDNGTGQCGTFTKCPACKKSV